MSFRKNRAEEIYIPKDVENFREDDVFKYLQNLEIELNNGLFTKNELLLLQDALYGKFLDKSRRPFFLYHFLPLWMNSVQILFRDCANPKIIELGCGTGTSSLLFAMLGAKVIGIEMNADLVGICNKRKRFYENHLGNINAKFYQANTFDFPFEAHATVDAFFSLFAFNLMKPADLLLARLLPSLKRGGKIIIIDGNQGSLYARLIPSKFRPGVLMPEMMGKKLEELGCKVLEIETHCAVPPFVFAFSGTRKLASKLEDLFRSSALYKFFSISYTVVAEKV